MTTEGKADGGCALFMAEALLKRLQALTAEVEGVRRAEDIECVHRMRVASRRLRAALALAEGHLSRRKVAAWQKETRRLTRALGAARDADVQIAFLQETLDALPEARLRPGVERLRLRLAQRREALQPPVMAALDRLAESQLAADMGQTLRQVVVRSRLDGRESITADVLREAYHAVARRLEEMLAYEPYVSKPECAEELHAMRIAAKRLRYTMELFAPLYEDGLKPPLQGVRALQELLGDIHDCDVWVSALPQFLEEEEQRTLAYFGSPRPMRRLAPGIAWLQQERHERRVRRHKEFTAAWQAAREQEAWPNLHRALKSRLEQPRTP
ncbi:MAG: CHAD domain-containing protein [Armatimonadetes bacterium]|nr:CHAD domain-containing protein [Armatimonadota bacterium]